MLKPVASAEQQHSGAKTTFHTHQHSLIGVENFNKRASDDENSRAAVEMSGYLGRQSSYNGNGAKVAPP